MSRTMPLSQLLPDLALTARTFAHLLMSFFGADMPEAAYEQLREQRRGRDAAGRQRRPGMRQAGEGVEVRRFEVEPAALRQQVERDRPDFQHDLSAMRRESIRLALAQAGEDTGLADEAFEVFFAERQRVELYPDALPALERLAATIGKNSRAWVET